MLGPDEIDKFCEKFEISWRLRNDLAVEEFLRENSAPVDSNLIDELIVQEVDLRNSAGLRPDQSKYQCRFPDHTKAIRLAFRRIGERADSLAYRVSTISHSSGGPSLDSLDEVDIPKQLGPYKIIKRLGTGKFGIVYEALDSTNNNRVALKFPRSNIVHSLNEFQQFCREAKSAEFLDHPAIVKSHGIRDINGIVFIVQQLVTGKNLAESMDRFSDVGEIVSLVATLADAIGYAHRAGLIHRDLKPANILLDDFRNPLIADFGLAVHEHYQRQLRGQRCGTPSYMSPEQVMGLTHQLDGRSDIWSLGVLLYELLTGKRPFGGSSIDELYEEIKFRNEKPLKMWRPDLDQELQRICSKCLTKAIRDRYATADDLADDLLNWIQFREQWASETRVPLVPRGLCSYGPDDAKAFKELIPGHRDRFGIPESIQFWKRNFDDVDGTQHFSVGVVFGPSGSGKSSFVRAGLIPNLDPKLVTSVFVEATESDTEVRLIKAFRNRFPDIPKYISLPEIFSGLRNRRWSNGDSRILIVLDQFEQWIHQHDAVEKSQLILALRHCDGPNLSCILIIRDEYWLQTSSLLNVLEIIPSESENTQRIDRFEKDHAFNVLFRIGSALGKLPSDLQKLTRQQIEFLKRVIADLCENERVICVHLTLFAEMFKNRDWTLKQLQKIGGVSAVGSKYLEETFGRESPSPRFREIESEARMILALLLPEPGTDLKGHMQSIGKLKNAVVPTSTTPRFERAISILSQDLRLIVRTEPNRSQHETELVGTNQYFQLTHDYLVPAIRNWLNQKQRETWRGRAELRLKELDEQWRNTNKSKLLPGFFDYVRIRAGIPNRKLSVSEFEFIRRADWSYGLKITFLLLSVVLAISISRHFWARNAERHQQAISLYDQYIQGSSFAIPSNLELLQPFASYLDGEINRSLSSDVSKIRSRASIAKHAFGDSSSQVIKSLAFDLSDKTNDHATLEQQQEFKYILSILEQHSGIAIECLKERFEESMGEPLCMNHRNRLAIALLLLGSTDEASEIAGLNEDRTGATFLQRDLNQLFPDQAKLAELLLSQQVLGDADLLFSLLVSASFYDFDDWSLEMQSDLEGLIKRSFQHHGDAGIHGVCRYLANRWEFDIGNSEPTNAPRDGFDWWNVQIAKDIQLTFVRVRPDDFIRGENSPPGYLNDVFPRELVSIDTEFWICQTETPFKVCDWWMLETNPVEKRINRTIAERFKQQQRIKAFFNASNEDLPVFGISFHEVNSLVAYLNQVDRPKGFRFDLPSSDEWELACRNGAKTFFHFGNRQTIPLLGSYAQIKTSFDIAPKTDQTHLVALPFSKIPTRNGLSDMAGNLSEFVRSTAREVEIDRKQNRNERCFLKGGNLGQRNECSSGYHMSQTVNNPYAFDGFRLILVKEN